MLITPNIATRTEIYAEAPHCALYAELRPYIDKIKGDLWRVPGGGFAVYAGPNMAINRAIGVGVPFPSSESDDLSDQLQQIEGFYQRHKLPPTVDFCPYADDALLTLLVERHYKPLSQYNVWVRELDQSEAFAPDPAIEIETDPSESEWVQTVDRGFLGRDELSTDDYRQPYAQLAFRRSSLVLEIQHKSFCTLARIDGEAVGGGATSIFHDTALLYSGSTRVQFRGRGIQTALILARLQLAASRGATMAVVKTKPGGHAERNIQRVGFVLAYSKMVFWRPTAP